MPQLGSNYVQWISHANKSKLFGKQMMRPGTGTGSPGRNCRTSDMEEYLETISSQTQLRASSLLSCPAWPALVDSFHAAFLREDSRHGMQGFCSPHSREIIKQFFLTSWTFHLLSLSITSTFSNHRILRLSSGVKGLLFNGDRTFCKLHEVTMFIIEAPAVPNLFHLANSERWHVFFLHSKNPG